MIGFNENRATDLARWLRQECIHLGELRVGDIIIEEHNVIAVCSIERGPPNGHEATLNEMWRNCTEVTRWQDVDGNGSGWPSTLTVRILARDMVTLTEQDITDEARG